MGSVRWTDEAAAWLEDVYRYIALEDPAAAAKVVQGIYDKAQSLAEFPRSGYGYRRTPAGEVRVLLYGHYRIAYLAHEEKDVTILGIFHGALNMDQYL